MTTRERLLVPALLFIGAVGSVISSLGAPLIPELAQRVHTSIGNAQWALTATVLVAAVASPVVGRLGDGRHRKTVLLSCLTLVVAGGLLAAVATTVGVLIAGRAFQGLGLAVIPLCMAAARDHLPKERAAGAIAGLSVVGAAGVGLGYPITGLLADHGGVAVAYGVGTAVSALALLAAWIFVPAPTGNEQQTRVDVPGAILVGAALVTLLVGLDKGADWGWGSTRVVSMVIGGLVLLGVWTLYELKVTDPLVDLRLVKRRPVLTANVSGLLLGVVMYLSMVSVTQFVQLQGVGLGETVFIAGLTLLPLSIFSAAASRTLPWLAKHIGLRPVLPFGALMVAGSSLVFAVAHSHLWQIFVVTAVLGVGLGYTFAAMPGLIVSAVPPDETSSAMGFYQVSRYVGFAIGSGLAVTLLRAFGTADTLTIDSYIGTAWVAVGLGVVTALVAWALPGRSTAGPRSADVDAFEVEEGLLASAGLEDLDTPAGRV